MIEEIHSSSSTPSGNQRVLHKCATIDGITRISQLMRRITAVVKWFSDITLTNNL